MKNILTSILLISLNYLAIAQHTNFINQEQATIFQDLSYGLHERNKYDLIVPKGDGPFPLVIFIHGGGFSEGDKVVFYHRKEEIQYFLNNNIALATINYRYRQSNDSLGIKVCINDCQTALQYLRHNATQYNIDKNKVALYGHSAGAGTSLYLAFHDEMAIKGDTSLKGESTRISCAGALDTQGTYDIMAWKEYIPGLAFLTALVPQKLNHATANFYGYSDYKSFAPRHKEVAQSLDMLAMINKYAPPIYLYNSMTEKWPTNMNIIQHHKAHAYAVAKKLDEYHIPHYVYRHKEEGDTPRLNVAQFLVKHLK